MYLNIKKIMVSLESALNSLQSKAKKNNVKNLQQLYVFSNFHIYMQVLKANQLL